MPFRAALPVTDLTVNVPGGTPLTVRRIYDSQAKRTEGSAKLYGLMVSHSSLAGA